MVRVEGGGEGKVEGGGEGGGVASSSDVPLVFRCY